MRVERFQQPTIAEQRPLQRDLLGKKLESGLMPEMSLHLFVFLVGVAGFTAAAAIWDYRERRIPNKLTLPVFGLGLVYQGVFGGLSGLGDAGLGFLLGFGTLFVLWMIGGGGGGDVKLMGALSVWLGFRLTLHVMIGSTILVILLTMMSVLWSVLSKGPGKLKAKLIQTRKPTEMGKKNVVTTEQKRQRRVLPFAIPVAAATWMVVMWKLPTFPW